LLQPGGDGADRDGCASCNCPGSDRCIRPAKIEPTIDVDDPDMQNLLKMLKVGDEVDLTYTEALAVSVEKMPS